MFRPRDPLALCAQRRSQHPRLSANGGAHGRLTQRAELSRLPEGFAGTNVASDLLASADCRFLYVCNQRIDHGAVFALETATGLPCLAGPYVSVPSPACAKVMGEAGP